MRKPSQIEMEIEERSEEEANGFSWAQAECDVCGESTVLAVWFPVEGPTNNNCGISAFKICSKCLLKIVLFFANENEAFLADLLLQLRERKLKDKNC